MKATQKAKGPVEAPTNLPSQNSNTQTNGMMNMHSNNMESCPPATERSFRSLMMELESPIRDAKNAVSLLHLQLDQHFTRDHSALTKNSDYWYLSKDDVDDLVFTANLISGLVRKTISQWEKAVEAKQ